MRSWPDTRTCPHPLGLPVWIPFVFADSTRDSTFLCVCDTALSVPLGRLVHVASCLPQQDCCRCMSPALIRIYYTSIWQKLPNLQRHPRQVYLRIGQVLDHRIYEQSLTCCRHMVSDGTDFSSLVRCMSAFCVVCGVCAYYNE